MGYSWLNGRQYSSAHQVGRYCFVTHSRSIAALSAHYPFHSHGLAPSDVDAALRKDIRNPVLTRSIARWLADLHFGIRLWAVFERAGDQKRSPRIQPLSESDDVHPEEPELQEAFGRFGLHWHEG